MHFELRINAEPITKVSVVWKRPADLAADGLAGFQSCGDWTHGGGNYVYEWTAWRVDPESPNGMSLRNHASGEVIHCYQDGIEELAIKVLREYRRISRVSGKNETMFQENTR